MNFDMTNPYEIARYIKEAKKATPARAYVKGDLSGIEQDGIKIFGTGDFWMLVGDYHAICALLEAYQGRVIYSDITFDRRNSAVPMLDISGLEARIEPGAFIRDRVKIGKHAVVMMGAVINIGAEIGDGTMIDMNAVIGARALIGKNVHVGAGSVIAGVLEPPSAEPVIIGDGVMIGANASILEGVRVGNNAVVAAGSVVTRDVPEGSVVAGAPAKVIKQKDAKTEAKTQFLEDLRQ